MDDFPVASLFCEMGGLEMMTFKAGLKIARGSSIVIPLITQQNVSIERHLPLPPKKETLRETLRVL
jgi:hypothetical protein